MFGRNKFDVGGVIPIVKCIRYNSNINPQKLKEQLLKNMTQELMQYTQFEVEDKGDGTTLLSARLDVIRKDNIKE